MRIIAGDHRGRAILPPADAKTTRPITDRVKEALFNRLISLGLLRPDGENAGWAVLDVFCGTGSLGLEALSRGAFACTFVDQDRDAIALLRENLDAFKLTDRARVVHGSALAGFWADAIEPGSVQVAFFDPPYAMMQADPDRERVLELVGRLRPAIEPGGVVMVRTPSEVHLSELDGYEGPGAVDYGGMRLHFYQAPLEEDAL